MGNVMCATECIALELKRGVWAKNVKLRDTSVQMGVKHFSSCI